MRTLPLLTMVMWILLEGCLGKCDPKKEICRQTGGGDASGDVEEPTDAGQDSTGPGEDAAEPDAEPACNADGTCDCYEDPGNCESDCLGCLDDGECDANEDCSCGDCVELCSAC